MKGLPTLKKVIVVNYTGNAAATVAKLPNAVTFDDFIEAYAPAPSTM